MLRVSHRALASRAIIANWSAVQAVRHLRVLPRTAGAAKPSASSSAGLAVQTAVEKLKQASSDKKMHDFVHQMKAIAKDSSLQGLLAEATVALLEATADRIADRKQLAEWIWCLGVYGYDMKQPRHKELILRSIALLDLSAPPAGSSSTSSLMQMMTGLQMTGMKLSKLLPAEREAVLGRLMDEQLLDHSHTLRTLLTGLAAIGAQWTHIHPTARRAIWKHLLAHIQPILSDALLSAEVVSALGSMRCQPMVSGQKDLIIDLALHSIVSEGDRSSSIKGQQQMAAQNARTLHALQRMGFTYDVLPADLIDKFESSMSDLLPLAGPAELVSMLSALGSMSVPWVKLTAALRDAILLAISTLTASHARHAGSLLQALGQMGVKAADLPAHVLQAVTSMLTHQPQPQPQQQPMALSFAECRLLLDSLLVMGVSYSPNPEADGLQKGVVAVINALAQTCDQQPDHLSYALDTLACLQFPWSALPKHITRALERHISRQEYACGQLPAMLLALGATQTSWFALHKTTTSALLKACTARGMEKKPEYLSDALAGLADMQALWSVLPAPKLQDMLVRQATKMNEEQLVNVLASLDMLEARWTDLPAAGKALASACEDLGASLSADHWLTVMHALTGMAFDCAYQEDLWSMHRKCLQWFHQLPADAQQSSYGKCSSYFVVLAAQPEGKQLIEEVLGGAVPAAEDELQGQEVIQDMLKTMEAKTPGGFHLVPSFPVHGKIIDYAVHHDSKLVGFILLDDPSSKCRADGSEVLKRSEKLTECLLKLAYPMQAPAPAAVYRGKADEEALTQLMGKIVSDFNRIKSDGLP